jgi:nucleotide-binding universal stress UspA family protein
VSDVLGEEAGRSVRLVAEGGVPGEVLVRSASGARLLVVGSLTSSRLQGMVLGSVALHCVVHAPCPVMVVRPRGAATPTDAATEEAAAPVR